MTAERGFTDGISQTQESIIQRGETLINDLKASFTVPFNTADGKAPVFKVQEGKDISSTAQKNIIYLAQAITTKPNKEKVQD